MTQPTLDPREPTATSVQKTTEEGLHAGELAALALRYRKRIAFATLGTGLAAWIVSLFLPNQFTATTTILPPQQNTSLSSVLATQIGNIGALGALSGGGLGLKDPNDIYIGMLQSRTVEDPILEKFHLAEVYRAKKHSLALKALEKRTTIVSTKTGFISISVEDRDPNRAAAIANAYVEQFQSLRSTLAVTEASQRRLFFEQQLKEAQQKLVTAEQQLKDMQQQTGVLQLDAQTRAAIASISQLKATIAAKQVDLQVLGTYATADNPQRMLVEQEVASLQKQLALLEDNHASGKGDITVPTADIPGVGLTYLNRMRDVQYYQTIVELLAKQFEIAKLDEARQGTTLQVLDPATPPDTKSFPNRWLITLGFAVLGFLGALTYIGLRQLLSLHTEIKKLV